MGVKLRIEFADPAQCLFGNWMARRRMQIKEFPAAMRQASEFGNALLEQRFVSPVIVGHQMTTPILQEITRMLTAATGLIVEHHDPWRILHVIAPVGTHIGPLGFALAGIKLLHWCFIGM